MTCGRLVGRVKDVLEGEDGKITLPIPSYLIEHRTTLICIDLSNYQ
jgi:hypothetical protein